MKKMIWVIFTLFILSDCSSQSKENAYQAEIDDLNGTWNWHFNEENDEEIKKLIIEKQHDRSKDRMFSWGKGTYTPRSWYFEIENEKSVFHMDGGPSYTILTIRKVGISDIEFKILSPDESDYIDKKLKLAGEARNQEREKMAHVMVAHFESANRMSIDCQDKTFLGTPDNKPWPFYRLSGANMKLQPDGTLK